jgi:predicted transcriptional regulator
MSRGKQVDPKQLTKLKKFLKKARTIDELMTFLDVSRSTVYRYLSRLEDQGALLGASMSRPTKYRCS